MRKCKLIVFSSFLNLDYEVINDDNYLPMVQKLDAVQTVNNYMVRNNMHNTISVKGTYPYHTDIGLVFVPEKFEVFASNCSFTRPNEDGSVDITQRVDDDVKITIKGPIPTANFQEVTLKYISSETFMDLYARVKLNNEDKSNNFNMYSMFQTLGLTDKNQLKVSKSLHPGVDFRGRPFSRYTYNTFKFSKPTNSYLHHEPTFIEDTENNKYELDNGSESDSDTDDEVGNEALDQVRKEMLTDHSPVIGTALEIQLVVGVFHHIFSSY